MTGTVTAVAVWARGLLVTHPTRILGVAACLAIAVSLLTALGGFIDGAKSTMTARAARAADVDWQIHVQPGADPHALLDRIRAYPGVRVADPVGFAEAVGLSSTTAEGTVQNTGPAALLGFPDQYRQHFPAVVRTLTGTGAGAGAGVQLTQQTAANLRAAPGSVVTVRMPGGNTSDVTVDTIIDLPQADALFRSVGVPGGGQPQAPPDNVMVLPASGFDAVVHGAPPETLHPQVHLARTRELPADPAAAYATDTRQAQNLEATLAGGGVVADNLAAALGAAREDALYSQVLFLFLGLPAVVLSAALAATIVAAAGGSRRREQALLRTRGATPGQIIALAGAGALVAGAAGSMVGVGIGIAVQHGLSGTVPSTRWPLVAATTGLVLAAAVVLVPAVRDLRSTSVLASRATTERTHPVLWRWAGLDLLALAGAYLLYRVTTRAGYTLVLAPEGVSTVSVSYWAVLGPALLWVGTGLLTLRLIDLLLGRGRHVVAVLLHPLTGTLSGPVASMLARRRTALSRSTAVVVLAVMFAVSTAVFTSTYRQQAEIDARLTNGADVTVTEPATATVGPEFADQLRDIPGVRRVEPLQHRFAYVGSDLQDLFGVDPATITAAASLQDAYFDGGSAADLMSRLAAEPDGILVSTETVTDFQLVPGDLVTLRIPGATTTAAARAVPFHLLGVVKEFPTAPKDSFLVANAAYLTEVTANPAVGAFLLDTGGADTAAVRRAATDLAGATATVTDLSEVRGTVGSTLTSVDLRGLAALLLAYAAVLAAAGAALLLALGFLARTRNFTILTALGGSGRQLASIAVADALVITTGAAVIGTAGAAMLSQVLVAVLTGVFDPPPATLAVPGQYLALLAAATVSAVCVSVGVFAAAARRASITALHE